MSVLCGRRLRAVPAADVRYRRLAPLLDPLQEFAEHRSGHPDRNAARTRFQKLYNQMAEPSRGLLGISSSAVELYPHQVGVARRVLADPVQRYLLADEVGLGKTIEAGFVIRQRLLDAPRSVIVVLTPAALRWQWEHELETKFNLSEFRAGGVEVSSYEDELALKRLVVPDLVVFDEAHRIAQGWQSPVAELASRYEAARHLAHHVPRLLLLSATPVLHRERDLLAMLHLLDPDTYPLDDLDAFVARVRDRERIGELMLSLRPGIPAFLLASRLPDLRETFRTDPRMMQLLDRLEGGDGEPEDEREAALADTRAHVSETYRLHRRLLRNRRSAITTTSYTVRGRAGVDLVADADPRRPAIDEWLERWRTTLLADAHERREPDQFSKAVRAFKVYVAAATGDLEVLRDVVDFRRTLRRPLRLSAGLNLQDASAIRGFELSDAQRAAFAELDETLGDADTQRSRRMETIAGRISGREGAHVLFASAPGTVAAITATLEQSELEVMTYTSDMTDEARRNTALAFMQRTGTRFLICDATGEEGLNLQVADTVIHLDLPLSTTRIEQRTGRVDRYGAARPVHSFAIDPGPPRGYCAWWFRALRDGFGVFDATTAPIQYAAETVEHDLFERMFAEGVEEAEGLLPAVRQRLSEEQARIDKVDSLDALARQEADDVEFVDAVTSVETDHSAEFSAAVFDALKGAGGLPGTITTRALGGRCVEFARKSPPIETFPGLAASSTTTTTANRRLAASDEELSLLRPGSPLVEALQTHLDWDDQSQTTVAYIADPSAASHHLCIRCDLIIRADPSSGFTRWKELEATRPGTSTATRTDADAPLAQAALQRRVDAYLPPTAVSLWVDGDGHPLNDPTLVTKLEKALNEQQKPAAWTESDWAAAARAAGSLSMTDLAADIRPKAERAALDLIHVTATAEAAAARAEQEWEEVERLLELRTKVSVEGRSAARDLAAEREVASMLLEAIRTPACRWSGACLVLVGPPEHGVA